MLGMLGGLGAIGSAGCAAVEPPGGNTEGNTVQFSGASDARFVELYEAMSQSVVEMHIPGPQEPMEPAGGSGFLMEDIGLVTNAHVVTDTPTVELRFHDREWREASILETDSHSDLAVVDASNVPDDMDALPFGDGVPSIGTEAMVIGAPLGLGGSATTGIVSGVDRVLPSPTGFAIPAAIQTDAAVNPGNSGGPLVDLDGNVIGVVFAGATENIGFAISGPLANRVLPVLADEEAFEHSYVGVHLIEVGPGIADANDLPEPDGVYLNEVVSDTPAEGVLQETTDETTVNGEQIPVGGDVIRSIDGTATSYLDAFQTYMALETDPGDSVEFDIYRDGDLQTVDLELGSRPDATALP